MSGDSSRVFASESSSVFARSVVAGLSPASPGPGSDGAPAVPGASPLSNNNLHCSSCHDPHGNDGFRLLYQAGQNVSVGGDLVTYGTSMVDAGMPLTDVRDNLGHAAVVTTEIYLHDDQRERHRRSRTHKLG